MSMKKQLMCLAILIAVAFLASCGSGGVASGGGGGTITPAPTVTLTANPASVASGQSSTLTWSSTNATSCSAPWTSSTATSGTQTVSPASTTAYSMTCTGAGGSNSASATVTVTAAVPTVSSFTASPSSINQGDSVTLAWTSNGTSVSLSGPGLALNSQPASGSVSINPTQTGTLTYTAIATGPGGTSQPATTNVTVNPAPVVTSVTVTGPSTIAANATAQFSAAVQGSGNFNSAVTWDVNPAAAGTINASGVFTPTGTAQQGITVTATSAQTTTISGSATVDTTRVITGFSVFEADCGISGCLTAFHVKGAGFGPNDILNIVPARTDAGWSYLNPNDFQVTLSFGTLPGLYDVGSFDISFCESAGVACSNAGHWNFGGAGGNLGGRNGNGEDIRLDPGSEQLFKVNPDGSMGTVLGNIFATAIDVDRTGAPYLYTGIGKWYPVVVNNVGSVQAFDADHTISGSHAYGGSASLPLTDPAGQVAVTNGLVGFTQPTKHAVGFFNANAATNAAVFDTTAGTNPQAIAMSAGCGGTDAFAFDAEGLGFIRDSLTISTPISNPTVSRVGNISFDAATSTSHGFTPMSQFNITNLRRFIPVSDANCRPAVVAPYTTGKNSDGVTTYSYAVALIDGTTMTPLTFVDANNLPIGNYLTDQLLTGMVERAVMLPDGSGLLVEVLNTDQGGSDLVKIAFTDKGTTAVNAAVTHLGTVGGVFGSSLIVGTDSTGTWAHIGMRLLPSITYRLP